MVVITGEGGILMTSNFKFSVDVRCNSTVVVLLYCLMDMLLIKFLYEIPFQSNLYESYVIISFHSNYHLKLHILFRQCKY